MNKKQQRKLLCEIIKEDEKDGLYDLRIQEIISEHPLKGISVDIYNRYKDVDMDKVIKNLGNKKV